MRWKSSWVNEHITYLLITVMGKPNLNWSKVMDYQLKISLDGEKSGRKLEQLIPSHPSSQALLHPFTPNPLLYLPRSKRHRKWGMEIAVPSSPPCPLFLLTPSPSPAWPLRGHNSCQENQLPRIPLWLQRGLCWGPGVLPPVQPSVSAAVSPPSPPLAARQRSALFPARLRGSVLSYGGTGWFLAQGGPSEESCSPAVAHEHPKYNSEVGSNFDHEC